MKNRATIIVIEGTDGSGKETQANKLLEYFIDINLKVKKFDFPDYKLPTGKIIGGPFLGKKEISESYFEETPYKVDPIISSLYYAADRRYAFLNFIEEELYKNDIIILDRYTTSNLGFQMCKAKVKANRKKLKRTIESLEYGLCELPKPDIIIFLNMPQKATSLLRKGRSLDLNEKNNKYIGESIKEYIKLAKEERWSIVNCAKNKFTTIEDIKSIEDIHKEIIDIVNKKFKTRKKAIKKMTKFW